jgi:hypothetical protein
MIQQITIIVPDKKNFLKCLGTVCRDGSRSGGSGTCVTLTSTLGMDNTFRGETVNDGLPVYNIELSGYNQTTEFFTIFT